MMLQLTTTEWLASLIAGGSVVTGVLIGILLLVRRPGSRVANTAMGTLLLVIAAAVLNELVMNVRPPDAGWRFAFPPLLYTYAIGPLLYLYVRAKLGRAHRLSVWHWVLPVAQAALTVGMALASDALKAAYMKGVYIPWYSVLEDVIFTLSLGGYLALSYRAVARARQSASFAWEQSRHTWLHRLLSGSAAAFGVTIVFNVANPVLAVWAGINVYAIESLVFAENAAYSLLLYWIALGGLVQAVPQAHTLIREVKPERKEHYNLSQDLVATHRQALARLTETEKPYLDPDLTLPVLAEQLGVTAKVLSYVLNEGMDTTYTDYINGLRVEEAKRQLMAPESAHLAVLGVGLDAGFRSKATFNRAFKRATGRTPSSFRTAFQTERLSKS